MTTCMNPIRSTGTKVIAVYVVGELAVQLFLKASLVGSTTYGSSTKCTNTGLQSFSDFAPLFNILKMHIIGVELYRYAYVIKPQTFFQTMQKSRTCLFYLDRFARRSKLLCVGHPVHLTILNMQACIIHFRHAGIRLSQIFLFSNRCYHFCDVTLSVAVNWHIA